MKERKAGRDGPSVLRFKARLFRHPKAVKSDGSATLLLDVPDVVSKRARSSGMTTVEGTINGHPFRATLDPNTSAGHWLPVNKAMRQGADADVGDTVQLAILEPEPEPIMPGDLRVALTASGVPIGSAGSFQPSSLRPAPAASRGPSNSFPKGSGGLVV